MAVFYVSVVPPTSATATGAQSVANNDQLLEIFINQTLGPNGTLIQVLELGPRLTLVYSLSA